MKSLASVLPLVAMALLSIPSSAVAAPSIDLMRVPENGIQPSESRRGSPDFQRSQRIVRDCPHASLDHSRLPDEQRFVLRGPHGDPRRLGNGGLGVLRSRRVREFPGYASLRASGKGQAQTSSRGQQRERRNPFGVDGRNRMAKRRSARLATFRPGRATLSEQARKDGIPVWSFAAAIAKPDGRFAILY